MNQAFLRRSIERALGATCYFGVTGRTASLLDSRAEGTHLPLVAPAAPPRLPHRLFR
jgi:hypothetical protein